MLIGVYHGAVLGGGGGEVAVRANIRLGRRGVASDMAFVFTAYTSMAVVVGEYKSKGFQRLGKFSRPSQTYHFADEIRRDKVNSAVGFINCVLRAPLH